MNNMEMEFRENHCRSVVESQLVGRNPNADYIDLLKKKVRLERRHLNQTLKL